MLLWSFSLATSSFAQSETRQGSTSKAGPTATANQSSQSFVAEPKPQNANPFQPVTNRDVRLPVVLDGFCLVTLRELQKWQLGSDSNQVVFDGQLYWFASQHERAMFTANPRRYAPALAGKCVVTFADSGVRVRGDPQYGSLHNQRLFFFKGLAEQKLFQADPEHYANIDLANAGRCLVSQVDEGRQLPGMSETTVIVDGLRYQFAGTYQQQSFLRNMARYGITRPSTGELSDRRHSIPPQPLVPRGSSNRGPSEKSKLPVENQITDVTNIAMRGYCPVTIHKEGTWVLGDARYRVLFDGLTYMAASEEAQSLFKENPNAYLPALGGHCAVNEIDNNQRVPGSIYHAAWHESEGRLFLFEGAEQKKMFNANPEKYLKADLVEKGNCIVTLVDEGRMDAGLPELLIWHQHKRYYFASKDQQAKFLENVQRYQDR